PYDLNYMWNLKKTKLTDTENRCMVARGRGVGEMGKGSQKVQTSSDKINKSWGCNAQHGSHS
ncbi:hypothetical protein C0133_08915, partial [Moraxella catarrhalis]|nr:hypothetical protein [Moraxella catarrhalis]